MLNQGFIEIAYDQKNVVQITKAGEQVLFENKKVNLVNVFELNKKKTQKIAKARPISKTKQLSNLRQIIAESEAVPPHVVFGDVSLHEMAKSKPTIKSDFVDIQGVGEFKNEKYGDTFIKEIIKFIIDKTNEGFTIKGSTYIVTHELYKQGVSISEIAKQRKLGEATIYSHLGKLYQNGYDIDIHKIITSEELKSIKKAIKEIGFEKGAKQLFFHLDEKISYGKIYLGIAYWKDKN